MRSGFTHFYCHQVVLSTQKNFEGFFNISGRLIAARCTPTAKDIVSGPLVQPQRPTQKSGPLAARAISSKEYCIEPREHRKIIFHQYHWK